MYFHTYQQATPTPTPTTFEATNSFPALLNFASIFKFNEKVTNLENYLSEMKQVNQYAQALSSIPAIILPQAVLDFATPVIEKNVTESLEATVLAKSSSQPKSTYESAESLSEELYNALVKSYEIDKDLFDTYGEVFTLKRSGDDKDKDQDPSSGSDRGMKRRKSSKDAEFKKPVRPPTLDPDWNKRQHVVFQPPQTWISQVSHTKEPTTSFDELMNTPIDFSAFVLNRLNIKDLTQAILVGPAFDLLKGTNKSLIELEYHLKECSKAIIERLDWHNPEGKPYPFDLSKPPSLIPDHRGRQVIPQDYFINNDLEYLKGGDLRRRY
ncbi:hypothetical protein Tco_0747903 [Tanacetum coccineum]|uniref:Uncharacterized protein n=1 Tax=Tanacetum coccineum TaxID=301880 RepID=A0ABQ4YUW8_9ASTR